MTFKARLIASITIAATIVMAVFFYIAYVSLGITESRFSEEAVRGKGVLWQKVIKVQLDQMEVSTSSLTRARDVLKALRESKFNELTEAAAPTFNRLSSSNVITKLQIADNSGSIIYSQPHDFGGPTRKTLVRQAIDEQKVFRGIERDDDGQLTAEVAFPLYYRGKPVGVGIYMTSLDGALNDFKQADGSDLHIFSSDRQLEITTDAEQFASIETRANDAGNAQHYTQNIDDQVISLVQMPLQDASGIAVANLVTATDYSESYARQSNVYIGGFSSGMLAFIACILFIYWYIGKAFKPMHQCLAVMEKISAGNLTETITVTTRDEFGQLMQGLQTMQTKLKSMINDINEATAQIESSAGNLEKVTLDSSESASNQQMITHQLSENIQQLIDASHEVSTSADDSSDASEQADTEVARGKSVIVDSVDTINLISQQINSAEAVVKQVHEGTETIGGVLDVIKGIAEQTNLLALNAAIEAARAGEQGRGFAVVADEVRTLASRTSESTSEIEAMIETLQKGASEAVEKMTGSIESVNKGVEIANLADESFNSIAQAVNSIRDKSRNIATASNHQMQLSQSMGEDIETISQSSEKAVAGNQSAVVSTEELTELAEKLKQKVSQFHT